MDYHCFLSHNGKDKPAVRQLCKRLEAAGLKVWLDEEDLLFGENWQPAIEQAIRDSAAGLVAIGPNGMGNWHRQELEFLLREAERTGRPVIPVLLAGSPEPQAISGFVMNRSACDLRDDHDGSTFRKLARELREQRHAPGVAMASDGGQGAGSPLTDDVLPSIPIEVVATEDAADEAAQVRRLLDELPAQLDPVPRCRLVPMDPAVAGTHATVPRLTVAILGWQLGVDADAWGRLADARGEPDASAAGTALLLYRRDDAPALKPTDPDLQQRLATWAALEKLATKLGADCPAAEPELGQAAEPTWQRPCWHRYPPNGTAALIEQIAADLAPWLERLLPRPVAGADAVPALVADVSRWLGSPYPGLVPLRDTESAIFFGRGRQVDELIARLAEPGRRFLPVVGASGSGKSSLVWAGLLPRLMPRLREERAAQRGGALPGSAHWRWARFTPQGEGPQDDPFQAMARALAYGADFKVCRFETEALARRLRKPAELSAVVDEALARADAAAHLLLFIDQFEELFAQPETVQRDFAGLLAAGAGIGRLRMVVTMRNEFAGRVAELPALAELFNQGAYWLRAPGRLARRDMILGPARRAGLQLEGGDSGALVQRLIDETGEEPGALPLMAYALQELFDRDGSLGVLTLASYDAFGGVPGAIARTAEAIFGEFAEQQGQDTAQRALQVLFRELVDVRDAVAPPTRRRARNDDLCTGDEEAAALAERFKAKRLLVTDREIAAPASATVRGAAGEAVVEVAHEALLTRWERLSHWIESRRNQFWLRERLRRDSADWRVAGYPTKLLPSVERARDLRDALAVLGQAPSDAERAFLDPVFRARWRLEEDLSAWRKVREAGELNADRRLWSADRLRGFADIDAYLEADAASENGGDAAQSAADAPQSYVREPGPLLPDQTPEQREFLRASFECAVAAPELHDTPKLRAALGNALANLGDPRFDPDHWWLPDDATMGFRHVPAGRFLMGSPKGEGWDDEWEQHALDLPDFWIGRWPVTVAQWAACVEVTGYDAHPISLDARPNHPAVLVSWHDARAYTDWLGEQMQAKAANRADQASDAGAGAFWRAVADGKVHCGLPSEAEWEKAAGGTDARRYPFGDAITPALANYQDTRIGTTSAVGCFPAGAGPYGCEEQAGNVWEWTRSLWGEDWNVVRYRYRYRRDDGRENLDAGNDVLRVLRGGAFDLVSNYCRSAVRNRYLPNLRLTNLGFRVVWSPLL